MKDKVNNPLGRPLSWDEYETEGTWEESDGRHFCLLCRKMLRVGQRVIETTAHPIHRGSAGDTYWQHAKCPVKESQS